MAATMKAIIKERPAPGATQVDLPIPGIGPNDVLVQVRATTICGTDYHIYSWDAWSQGRVKPPLTVGHEMAGEVVAVGGEVTSVKVGDHVSAETHIVCHVCARCRNGEYHLCEQTRILGVDINGAFAEYVAIPEWNCWVNDRDLPFEIQSIQEPLGNAVHTALAGEIAGQTVAVVGCGPIGIMSVPVAKMCGAEAVYAIDVNPFRLDLARQLGADVLVDASRQDPVEAIRQVTGGHGSDVVLEMSGNPRAIQQSIAAVRNGGRVSMLGLPNRAVEIDLANQVIMRGVTLQGIAGRKLFKTWFQVRSLMRAGLAERLAPMVTHRLPLAEIGKGMELMREGKCGKVALIP